MSRVLLINPPQTYYRESQGFSVYVPLGLLSMAAVLRTVCEVRVLDCLIESYAEEEHDGILRYGAPDAYIERIVEEYQPAIIGISVPFTAQYNNARHAAALCRKLAPDALLVMGGPDPSVRSAQILAEGAADVCVLGEGEIAIRDVVTAYDAGNALNDIPGVALIDNGTFVQNPPERIDDIDSLRLPAYDLVDMEAYFSHPWLYHNRSHIHERSISVITSRGCPYSCVFCSIKLHMGQRYRAHSPAYVFRHLKLLIETYRIRHFHFEDDNISFNRKRFAAILDGILERRWRIQWDTPNGIRADTLTVDLLRRIKQTGCRQLTLAIESGNPRVLNEVIRKKTDLDTMIEVARQCKKLRIHANSFYVIGFPGERLEEMADTTRLALDLLHTADLLPTLMVATPLYGTELYTICMERGYIAGNPSPEELAKATQLFGKPMIATEDFSSEDIERLLSDYTRQLKRELVLFSFRHPLYAFHRAKQKLPVIMKLLTGRK